MADLVRVIHADEIAAGLGVGVVADDKDVALRIDDQFARRRGRIIAPGDRHAVAFESVGRVQIVDLSDDDVHQGYLFGAVNALAKPAERVGRVRRRLGRHVDGDARRLGFQAVVIYKHAGGEGARERVCVFSRNHEEAFVLDEDANDDARTGRAVAPVDFGGVR